MSHICLLVICITMCIILCAHSMEINPSTFSTTVLQDDRVWLVEFYSSMCGGCQEFAPTWGRIEKAFSSSSSGKMAAGMINIDDKAGMKLAEELGVLDDGVPHVRMFSRKTDKKGIPVVKSDSTLEYSKITKKINKLSEDLQKREDGHYIKH